MAQIIECDIHNREHRADVLISNLENGDTLAYCGDGLVTFARQVVEAADAPEREEADAAAIAALEGASAPADDDPGTYVDAQGREQDNADVERESSPEPAHVIRRGQNAKAIAYHARTAAQVEREAQASVAVQEPGPTDPTDDDESTDEDVAAP